MSKKNLFNKLLLSAVLLSSLGAHGAFQKDEFVKSKSSISNYSLLRVPSFLCSRVKGIVVSLAIWRKKVEPIANDSVNNSTKEEKDNKKEKKENNEYEYVNSLGNIIDGENCTVNQVEEKVISRLPFWQRYVWVAPVATLAAFVFGVLVAQVEIPLDI